MASEENALRDQREADAQWRAIMRHAEPLFCPACGGDYGEPDHCGYRRPLKCPPGCALCLGTRDEVAPMIVSSMKAPLLKWRADRKRRGAA